MSPLSLTADLKLEAQRLGFSLSGACPAVQPPGLHHLYDWLAAGYHGQMHYLPDRREAYEHPEHVLDGARSLLVLATSYRSVEPAACAPGAGRVSRYAWGADYHLPLRERLNQLADFLTSLVPTAKVRGVVDTAPLLEGEFAQLAGLGWIGKNTLVLNKQAGSWFFLAALLTDVELAYDEPHAAEHCGTCRACLDACPTGAFVEPYVLDSRRCISYLTIELKSAIPPELRSGLGDFVFGCDICQDVCPWNQRVAPDAEAGFAPRDGSNPIELAALFDLDEAAFRARFKSTPLWRPRRRGILRNAAIVLGNQRHASSLSALIKGLHDAEPLVRGACAWALGQIGGDARRAALKERRAAEADLEVQSEIDAALAASCHTIGMSISPDQIALTPNPETASRGDSREETGKPWNAVLEEALATFEQEAATNGRKWRKRVRCHAFGWDCWAQ